MAPMQLQATRAGKSFVHWRATPTLFGFALWGRPGQADIEALVRALLTELDPGVLPHCSVVDTALVDGVDPQAFEVLQRYVTRHHAALKRQVTQLALVRPAGLVGAVVSGFYEVLDSPYPTRAFADLTPALQWLGQDAGWADVLLGTRTELSGVSPLVVQLRAVLAGLGASPAVPAVAKALSLSQRTLQRRLAEQGTSFQQEVTRHRMEVAQRLMRESDAPLTAIAIDAGFASLAHFSAAFRKATGQSPTQWRATFKK